MCWVQQSHAWTVERALNSGTQRLARGDRVERVVYNVLKPFGRQRGAPRTRI
jgi:hypothetical protein